jgi:neutral trehalase
MVIVPGGRFNGNYRFGWDNYVFEGRCEKLN